MLPYTVIWGSECSRMVRGCGCGRGGDPLIPPPIMVDFRREKAIEERERDKRNSQLSPFHCFIGIQIIWDGVSFLEVNVPPEFRNRMCGLCGNFNGDSSDDFHGRRGGLYRDGQAFGDSWRVSEL